MTLEIREKFPIPERKDTKKVRTPEHAEDVIFLRQAEREEKDILEEAIISFGDAIVHLEKGEEGSWMDEKGDFQKVDEVQYQKEIKEALGRWEKKQRALAHIALFLALGKLALVIGKSLLVGKGVAAAGETIAMGGGHLLEGLKGIKKKIGSPDAKSSHSHTEMGMMIDTHILADQVKKIGGEPLKKMISGSEKLGGSVNDVLKKTLGIEITNRWQGDPPKNIGEIAEKTLCPIGVVVDVDRDHVPVKVFPDKTVKVSLLYKWARGFDSTEKKDAVAARVNAERKIEKTLDTVSTHVLSLPSTHDVLEKKAGSPKKTEIKVLGKGFTSLEGPESEGTKTLHQQDPENKHLGLLRAKDALKLFSETAAKKKMHISEIHAESGGEHLPSSQEWKALEVQAKKMYPGVSADQAMFQYISDCNHNKITDVKARSAFESAIESKRHVDISIESKGGNLLVEVPIPLAAVLPLMLPRFLLKLPKLAIDMWKIRPAYSGRILVQFDQGILKEPSDMDAVQHMKNRTEKWKSRGKYFEIAVMGIQDIQTESTKSTVQELCAGAGEDRLSGQSEEYKKEYHRLKDKEGLEEDQALWLARYKTEPAFAEKIDEELAIQLRIMQTSRIVPMMDSRTAKILPLLSERFQENLKIEMDTERVVPLDLKIRPTVIRQRIMGGNRRPMSVAFPDYLSSITEEEVDMLIADMKENRDHTHGSVHDVRIFLNDAVTEENQQRLHEILKRLSSAFPDGRYINHFQVFYRSSETDRQIEKKRGSTVSLSGEEAPIRHAVGVQPRADGAGMEPSGYEVYYLPMAESNTVNEVRPDEMEANLAATNPEVSGKTQKWSDTYRARKKPRGADAAISRALGGEMRDPYENAKVSEDSKLIIKRKKNEPIPSRIQGFFRRLLSGR